MCKMQRLGMVSPPGATGEFRNKSIKLSPSAACYKSDTAQFQRCRAAAAAAQVEAGDERVVWSQTSPLVQQPGTPSSSGEGLFIFLKASQFC